MQPPDLNITKPGYTEALNVAIKAIGDLNQPLQDTHKKIVLAHDYACELSRKHASSQGRAQCIQPSIHCQTYRFAISQEKI